MANWTACDEACGRSPTTCMIASRFRDRAFDKVWPTTSSVNTDPQAIEAPLRHAGYRAAFLYGGGPVRLPGTSHYRLSRLAMGPDTDLARALAAGAQEGTS